MAPAMCREPSVSGPIVMGSETLRAFGSAYWFGPVDKIVSLPAGLLACTRVRACVRARVCVCARVRVRVHACACLYACSACTQPC